MTTPLTFKTQLGLELNSLHKLSQGEEEEVSLIVLKRPPIKELHEEVEVCRIHISLLGLVRFFFSKILPVVSQLMCRRPKKK